MKKLNIGLALNALSEGERLDIAASSNPDLVFTIYKMAKKEAQTQEWAILARFKFLPVSSSCPF